MVDVGKDALVSKKDQGGMGRRTFLKGAAATVGLIAVGEGVRRLFAPGDGGGEVLIGEVPVGKINGRIYHVNAGDTIGAITRGAVSTEKYNTNQRGYDKKTLQANGMETPDIVEGQKLYIPDFETQTYGVALGKEALGLKFEAVEERDGKKYVRITTLGKTLSVAIDNDGLPQQSLSIRRQSGEPQFTFAIYVPGVPGRNVPDRIVLEQVKPPAK